MPNNKEVAYKILDLMLDKTALKLTEEGKKYHAIQHDHPFIVIRITEDLTMALYCSEIDQVIEDITLEDIVY